MLVSLMRDFFSSCLVQSSVQFELPGIPDKAVSSRRQFLFDVDISLDLSHSRLRSLKQLIHYSTTDYMYLFLVLIVKKIVSRIIFFFFLIYHWIFHSGSLKQGSMTLGHLSSIVNVKLLALTLYSYSI